MLGLFALGQIDHRRIAALLTVVAHAEGRVQRVEIAPVAALAQQAQPVVAQAVFLISASPAGEKGLHLVLRGFLQARAQLPIGRPGFQHMAACRWQQLAQLGLVALAEGLLHVHDDIVARHLRSRLRHRSGRSRGRGLQGRLHLDGALQDGLGGQRQRTGCQQGRHQRREQNFPTHGLELSQEGGTSTGRTMESGRRERITKSYTSGQARKSAGAAVLGACRHLQALTSIGNMHQADWCFY
ncbi:hypothetical protein D3C72_1108030 [compost metagenome]